MAYLAGYIIKDSDSVYGTELIFPEQHCFISRIHDEGIYDADRDIEYDSLNWILSKSWTAKMCSNTRIKKTTIVARITSIMKGKRLPSHELRRDLGFEIVNWTRLVHDVFRGPAYPGLFSIFVAMGFQYTIVALFFM